MIQSIFCPTDNTLFKQTLITLFGVVVLAIASQLSIPFIPVPLTFQSATVVLIGMAFGARQGASIVAAYLFAGLAGAPVFAGFNFGLAAFTGPTGGYLMGFLPAAYVAGYLVERGYGRSLIGSFAVALVSVSIIFLSGISVLASFVGWPTAVQLGLTPFILSESIKLLAISAITPRLWKNA